MATAAASPSGTTSSQASVTAPTDRAVPEEGVTTEKVAADAGLPYSTFNKKLNAEVRMSVDDLVWMADLGVVVPGPDRLQEIARRAMQSAPAHRRPPRPQLGGSHFDPGRSLQPVLPEDRTYRSQVAAAAALASMQSLAATPWM